MGKKQPRLGGGQRTARLLGFWELSLFQRRWRANRLNDDDLDDLQQQIILRPKAGRVVQDTGGLRKLRFVPKREQRGKRGAYRVGYAFFERCGAVLLIIVFAKNEQADLTNDERREIQGLIEEAEQELCP